MFRKKHLVIISAVIIFISCLAVPPTRAGTYIYIRYFPVRDKAGNYLGIVEVSQDITDIQKIKGEKRLLDM